MEKRVLLRAAAVRNSAAAKENCGRKSLLIEHEVCHLKLESSQPPETAAGRHLSGPDIKVPPGPGCVSPSHRGPFALAGAPSVCVSSRTVGHFVALDALLMPQRSGIWAHVTAASPGRDVEQGRRNRGDWAARSQIPTFMQSIYCQVAAAQVKASTQRAWTKAQCGWI